MGNLPLKPMKLLSVLYNLIRKAYNRVQPAAAGQEKIIGGNRSGWLITINETSKVITLSNTSTGVRIQLPEISPPLNDQQEEYFCSLESSEAQNRHTVHKAVISSTREDDEDDDDDDNLDDFVVMIIHGESKQLACYKSKDKTWGFLTEAGSSYDDVLSHEGDLYAVDEYGKVVLCMLHNSSPIVIVIAKRWFFWGQKVHLVVVEDLLFLIIRCTADIPGSGRVTIKFMAGQLTGDEHAGCLVQDLANWTVVVGRNHSVALPPCSASGMKANCIYFKDDCINVQQRDNLLLGSGFRVFSMEDRRIQKLLRPPDGLPSIWEQQIVS